MRWHWDDKSKSQILVRDWVLLQAWKLARECLSHLLSVSRPSPHRKLLMFFLFLRMMADLTIYYNCVMGRNHVLLVFQWTARMFRCVYSVVRESQILKPEISWFCVVFFKMSCVLTAMDFSKHVDSCDIRMSLPPWPD